MKKRKTNKRFLYFSMFEYLEKNAKVRRPINERTEKFGASSKQEENSDASVKRQSAQVSLVL